MFLYFLILTLVSTLPIKTLTLFICIYKYCLIFSTFFLGFVFRRFISWSCPEIHRLSIRSDFSGLTMQMRDNWNLIMKHRVIQERFRKIYGKYMLSSNLVSIKYFCFCICIGNYCWPWKSCVCTIDSLSTICINGSLRIRSR